MFCYTYGATTDKGDVRKENQDSILCQTGVIGGENAALFLVADGMGGLSYGAKVSHFIASRFERWWQEDFGLMVQDGMNREEEIREFLEQEIWETNQKVLAFNRAKHCRSGSTLSLLLLYRGQYYMEHIGDSRIYQMRNGELRQLTTDQSIGHKLTMCVGMFEVPKSVYCSGELRAGDVYCLCSDGFYHPLNQERFKTVLGSETLNAQEKAGQLRKEIAFGAASDNVSAIVAEVAEGEAWR